MNKIVFLLIFLLCIPISFGAVVKGEIYDFSLESVNDVLVQINTVPLQKQIAINGNYNFEVANGNYVIKVFSLNGDLVGKENITILDNGTYNLDIIVFPNLDDAGEDTEIDSTLQEINDTKTDNNSRYIISFILLLILITVMLLLWKFKFKKEDNLDESNDQLSNEVLEIIKKEKRINQKDLRKHFPLSEAKISLVISELEAKGKIEKIKKGRGNILILK